MKKIVRAGAYLLVFFIILFTGIPVQAEEGGASFEYKLIITDKDGREVHNPRSLSSGDKINVEIELTRTDDNSNSYDSYGIEFRLSTLGLDYNNDGISFREGTKITKQVFDDGDSVGFAYYDMEQKGEAVANPSVVGKWTYTVSDPEMINISVPVAIVFLTNDNTPYEPVGNAKLILDPNGGEIVGKDVSGDYKSGTKVTLPEVKYGDNKLEGWSDGIRLYQPGDEFIVTGITTLKAKWGEVERSRQIDFDPNGGTIKGENPSGKYADGESITIPEAERNSYSLNCWVLGDKEFKPGDTYIVDNSAIFIAKWDLLEAAATTEEVGGADKTEPEKSSFPIIWIVIPAALVAAGLCTFLILWKRKLVKYSLVDGSIVLSYRDVSADSKVTVILLDEGKKNKLGISDLVKAGDKLTFISGTGALEGIKEGKYKGRLDIQCENPKTIKYKDVRIKVESKKYKK